VITPVTEGFVNESPPFFWGEFPNRSVLAGIHESDFWRSLAPVLELGFFDAVREKLLEFYRCHRGRFLLDRRWFYGKRTTIYGINDLLALECVNGLVSVLPNPLTVTNP